MRAKFAPIIAAITGMAIAVPAMASLPAQAVTPWGDMSGISDMNLRSMLLVSKPERQLALIVPSSSAAALADQGFEIGDAIGTLPFRSATATDAELTAAAASGLAEGVSLNRRVPKPEPVTIPDGLEDFLVDWSQTTGASSLHARGYRGTGVGIAVIDDGIQASHPYFQDAAGVTRVVAESCFVTSEYRTPLFPCPGGGPSRIGPGAADVGSNVDFSHGTHVAGIAAGNAARASGAEGYTGMAPDAKLIISRVFGSGSAYDSDIVAALDWVSTLAATHNIAAVNLSLGFFIARYLDCTTYSDSIYSSVTDRVRAAGVAIVAAAGNNGSYFNLGGPGCATDWISVGATNYAGEVAYFSNISPEVDILAPGELLWSSVPINSFDAYQGTSMASPVAAGAWGLMRQAAPAASGDTVLAAVRATGPRIDDVIVKDLPTLRIDRAFEMLANPDMPALPTNVTTTATGANSVRINWNVSATGARPTSYLVKVGGRTLTSQTTSATFANVGGSGLVVSVTAKTPTLDGPAVLGQQAFPVDESLPQVFDEAGTGFGANYCPTGGAGAVLTYPAPANTAFRDIRITAGGQGETAVESGSALSRSITLLDPDLADSLATRLQDMAPSGAVSEVQQIGDLVDLIPDGLPARPRGLKGSSTGTGIKLSWEARGATQWRVLLDGSLAANVSQPEVTINATVGTHDVTVCATGSGASTSRAARATVEVGPTPTPVAPAAPTGVSAKRAGKSVSLSWTPPTGPVTLYVVEGRYGSQWRVIGTRTASPFKVTRTALGSASQLRVAAVNGAGQGPWSSAVAVPR